MGRQRSHHVVESIRQAIRDAWREGVDPQQAGFDDLTAEFDHLEGEVRRLQAELAALRRRTQVAEREVGVVSRVSEQALAHRLASTEVTAIPLAGLVCGYFVYLLRDESGAVIYVGKSRNVLSRLGAHLRDTKKATASSVTLIRCVDEPQMDYTEWLLIDHLRPRLNVVGVVGRPANPYVPPAVALPEEASALLA